MTPYGHADFFGVRDYVFLMYCVEKNLKFLNKIVFPESKAIFNTEFWENSRSHALSITVRHLK